MPTCLDVPTDSEGPVSQLAPHRAAFAARLTSANSNRYARVCQASTVQGMARDIDRLIEYVDTCDWLPPVHREVVKARLEAEPTKEELEVARKKVPGYNW